MGKILMQGTGGGTDLDLVTAKASDILQGKVIIGPDGEPLTGTIPILSARTITPGTGNQVINAGNYLGGNITVAGDTDLTAKNILEGKNIFGVTGTCKEYKSAHGNLTSSSSTKNFKISNGSTSSNEYYVTIPNTNSFKYIEGIIVCRNTGNRNSECITYQKWWEGITCYDGTYYQQINNGNTIDIPVSSRNTAYVYTIMGY